MEGVSGAVMGPEQRPAETEAEAKKLNEKELESAGRLVDRITQTIEKMQNWGVLMELGKSCFDNRNGQFEMKSDIVKQEMVRHAVDSVRVLSDVLENLKKGESPNVFSNQIEHAFQTINSLPRMYENFVQESIKYQTSGPIPKRTRKDEEQSFATLQAKQTEGEINLLSEYVNRLEMIFFGKESSENKLRSQGPVGINLKKPEKL